MKEQIPYIDLRSDADIYTPVPLPIPDLITEIVSRSNMEAAFDYVVSHLENKQQRDHLRPRKKNYVARLIQEISNGTFRITAQDFRTLLVTDGPKQRIVQCPKVYHRVGVHSIMVPFEKYAYSRLITNSGACVKGRGMHWLFHRVEEDFANVPELMQYFYMSDIVHFYDNIVQSTMKAQIRDYTTDPVLLPILDNFVELLNCNPETTRYNEDGELIGISKGLRSSQCFANLHLNDIDHKLCNQVKHYTVEDDEGEGHNLAVGVGEIKNDGRDVRYLYYRYCDDIRVYAATKKECWAARDILVEALAELKLKVKHNEAVRPIRVGDDFLGFHNFFTHVRIRKRIKQKFCRRLKKVKSRKRRQSLIVSFFGMVAHADCRHLLKTLLAPSEYKRLKHKREMKDFGELKIVPTTLDGKKNFRGTKINPRELNKQPFILVDFERGLTPRREQDEYQRRLQTAAMQGISPDLVEKPKTKYLCQIIYNGALRKMWTGDRELWNILDQIEAAGALPCFMSIEMDYTAQYPKANFVSATKFGHRRPSDAELDELLKQFNLK